MDEIRIRDLTVFARHGVLPEETALGQKFLLSMTLRRPLRRAALTGELSLSVNYAEACAFATQFMQERTYALIESAAEALAAALLERYDICSVAVELKKPWAPIGLPLEGVSVYIERAWHTAYIALGSNLGDREGYLRSAVEALRTADGCHVQRVSSFIVTPPYGGVEQGDFLNGCLELRTASNPPPAASGSSAGARARSTSTSSSTTALCWTATSSPSPIRTWPIGPSSSSH